MFLVFLDNARAEAGGDAVARIEIQIVDPVPGVPATSTRSFGGYVEP